MPQSIKIINIDSRLTMIWKILSWTRAICLNKQNQLIPELNKFCYIWI